MAGLGKYSPKIIAARSLPAAPRISPSFASKRARNGANTAQTTSPATIAPPSCASAVRQQPRAREAARPQQRERQADGRVEVRARERRRAVDGDGDAEAPDDRDLPEPLQGARQDGTGDRAGPEQDEQERAEGLADEGRRELLHGRYFNLHRYISAKREGAPTQPARGRAALGDALAESVGIEQHPELAVDPPRARLGRWRSRSSAGLVSSRRARISPACRSWRRWWLIRFCGSPSCPDISQLQISPSISSRKIRRRVGSASSRRKSPAGVRQIDVRLAEHR